MCSFTCVSEELDGLLCDEKESKLLEPQLCRSTSWQWTDHTEFSYSNFMQIYQLMLKWIIQSENEIFKVYTA